MDEEVGMKEEHRAAKGERSGRAATSWLQSGMCDGRSDETTSSFDGAAVGSRRLTKRVYGNTS